MSTKPVYKPQQGLLSGIQSKDPNTHAFLQNVDDYLAKNSKQSTPVTARGVLFFINGTLVTGTDLCPRYFAADSVKATSIRADVKTAPTGSAILITVYLGNAAWAYLMIPANSTSSGVITSGNYPSILAETPWRVDITQVGSTVAGADLTIRIIF
jgi:hypothetical protein